MHLQFPQISDKLTPAEHRLLEFIEGNREEFLFMTIGQLAKRMDVSEATISRFARHVGCQDFKQLKGLVIDQNHLEGPAGKLGGTLLTNGSFSAASYLQQQQLYIQKTLEYLDENIFDTAIKDILSAKKIFIHAKSASASVANLLYFRLRRLGLNVAMIPSGGSEILEVLAGADKDDLVIMFAFSKISWEGRVILEQKKEAGYKTLCFSGRIHAPEEDRADINLYVYRGEMREYHSMTSAAALVDALIVAVSERMGADGAKNLQKVHNLKKKFSF